MAANFLPSQNSGTGPGFMQPTGAPHIVGGLHFSGGPVSPNNQPTPYMNAPLGNPYQPHNMVGSTGGDSSGGGSVGGSSSGFGGALNNSLGTPNTGSNVGNFNTINTPQNIYSDTQTQQATNQAVAQARANADPRWQEKQFQTAGRSTDAGTLSAAAPGIGQSLSAAQSAMGMIPLQDYIANQNNMLSGQVNQENESLGLSQLMGNMSNNNLSNNLSWLSTLTGPVLGSLLQ